MSSVKNMPSEVSLTGGEEHVGMSETRIAQNQQAPPLCAKHGDEVVQMVLVFYDRPGSPPGNGWACPRCIEMARAASQPSETRTPYEIAPDTIVFTPADLDAYVAKKLEAELSPLRELVEKWRASSGKPDDWNWVDAIDSCADELAAALDRLGK